MPSHLFKVTVTQHWLYDCWVGRDGRPCPKDTPGARFVKSRKVRAGTPGARKVKTKSGKWYGRVPGSRKPVPLSANKVAAQQILAELVRKAELGRVGISDPFEEHRNRPLREHLDDYFRYLQAKGVTAKQAKQVRQRVSAVLDGCRFTFPGDLSASRLQEFLADLCRQGRAIPPLVPGTEWFTKAEAAAALRVSPVAFQALVRRHRLGAVGNGKARRFPRATVDLLRDRASRGRSTQTANYYLREVKSFCRWLVKDRRMSDNPLVYLAGGKAQADRRHDRRPLSSEELRQVIQAARQSTRMFRGLSGTDRAVIYALAAVSGFRAGELASLTPDDFRLDDEVPSISLSAAEAKNGRTAVQPLPPDVAELMREYLCDKPTDCQVWPGAWWADGDAAEMLRIDLEAAGIPYAVKGPDGPLYADFHALRHSYIALLDKSGATLKEAMQLARHSDPKLTAAVYGRAQLHDLGEAVRRLPSLLAGPGPETQARRATGTDPVCTGFVQTSDTRCSDMRRAEAQGSNGAENTAGLNPLSDQGVEAGCDAVRLDEASIPDRSRTMPHRPMTLFPCSIRDLRRQLRFVMTIELLPVVQNPAQFRRISPPSTPT
jgi:integrase